VLGLEFILRGNGIGGDTEDVGAGPGESGFEAGKVDRFLGAAGRVGARVEIEHQFAAGEVFEGHAAAAVAGKREGWCLGTWL